MKAPKLVREDQLHQWYGKRVLSREYQLPDGTKDTFYVFAGTTPVIILPLTADKEVIAVRQFRYGANEFVLEIPGGNIKVGETSFEAVQKELLEETGYMPFEISHLGQQPVWFDPASFTVGFFPVLALDCKKIQDPKPEKTEILETILIPLGKWIEMIFAGEICDSKTIAVTFLALRELGLEIGPKSR